MRQAWVLTIVVLLVAAIGLACGGGGAEPTNTSAPTATTAPTATMAPAEQPTATPDAMPDPTEPASNGDTTPSGEGDPEVGKEIATNQGCVACHSWDGTEIVGPTWMGLWGTNRLFEDGGSALVDEAFVKESIREPNLRIEVGFPPDTMPILPLTDQEIVHIIALIKSLQ